MKKQVRYGIIGFGAFAERTIAQAIRESPNSELMAIQKRSLAAAKEKARTFNISHAFGDAINGSQSQFVSIKHPDLCQAK
jgi:predicted dehydrogenase